MKLLIGTDLKRFLRDWRRANPPRHDFMIMLQSVAYPVNVGSLFRIADAVDLSHVLLTSATPTPESAKVAKVGRNKHARVPWSYEEDPEHAVQLVKGAGFHVCAIELTDASVPYHTFAYPQRTCFVLGNEDHGVSNAVLAHCDSAVFVPMFGKGRSLNVHVSASVVLYHAVMNQLEVDA